MLKEIRLELITDAYPDETTVFLQDLDTGEIFWKERFSDPNTLYTLTQEVDPAGCYEFVIEDAIGDGICCQYGFGSFELFYDGALVFSGGDFGFSDSYNIGDLK